MDDLTTSMLITRAKEAFQRQDYHLALDLFQKAKESPEPDPTLPLSLSAVYAALGCWKESLDYAEQAKFPMLFALVLAQLFGGKMQSFVLHCQQS